MATKGWSFGALTAALQGAAFLNVGVVAGTVAAGDDARIVGALQSSNSLQEIVTAGPAAVWKTLANLGLGGGLLAKNGYMILPLVTAAGVKSAVYIQWGGFSGTTSSANNNGIYESIPAITVTWPIAFPNAVLQVITGGSSDVSGAGQQEMAWSLGTTNNYGTFGFQCRAPNAPMIGSYLAIGY